VESDCVKCANLCAPATLTLRDTLSHTLSTRNWESLASSTPTYSLACRLLHNTAHALLLVEALVTAPSPYLCAPVRKQSNDGVMLSRMVSLRNDTPSGSASEITRHCGSLGGPIKQVCVPHSSTSSLPKLWVAWMNGCQKDVFRNLMALLVCEAGCIGLVVL
jgi:hypothetical protein